MVFHAKIKFFRFNAKKSNVKVEPKKYLNTNIILYIIIFIVQTSLVFFILRIQNEQKLYKYIYIYI